MLHVAVLAIASEEAGSASSPRRGSESNNDFGPKVGSGLAADRFAREASRMDSGLPSADCFVCAKHALGDAAPGGVLFEDGLAYAGHAYPLSEPVLAYRGYLVAEPVRHVAGLGDLTDPEAVALGLLVSHLARALKEVAEAEHVYSFVFGDGLAHLHVVLAPRYADTPREYWGVRLRKWPDAPRVGEPEMRGLVARLRRYLANG